MYHALTMVQRYDRSMEQSLAPRCDIIVDLCITTITIVNSDITTVQGNVPWCKYIIHHSYTMVSCLEVISLIILS
jgi:hypothetical protein